MQNAIGNESTFGIDTTELHKRQMAEKLQRLGRRWADGTNRDNLGNVLQNYAPDNKHAAWLNTHCRGCGESEGNICKDGCPRIEVEATKRGISVAAYFQEGERIRRGIGHAEEREVRNAVYKAAHEKGSAGHSHSYLTPLQQTEARNEALRARVADVFSYTGFYECQQDNLVVQMPDIDSAYLGIADGTFPLPMPADGSVPRDILRLEPRSFSFESHDVDVAMTNLVDALGGYMSGVVGANPHKGFQRGITHKLFAVWRIRPTVSQALEDGKWHARARFVAAWADKKFEPKLIKVPVADISGPLPVSEELNEASLLAACDRIEAIAKERGIKVADHFISKNAHFERSKQNDIVWSEPQDASRWVGTPGLTGDAYFDRAKAEAHHDRAFAALGHSFNPQTDLCVGCQMTRQELVEVGVERATTCATRLAEITIGGHIGTAIANELPPAGLEQVMIGGYKLRN